MVLITKGTMKWVLSMVKVVFSGRIIVIMQDSSTIIWFKDWAPTFGRIKEASQVTGLKVKWTGKVSLLGMMAESIVLIDSEILILLNWKNLIDFAFLVFNYFRFIGNYQNDKKHGYGKFIWPNGKIFKVIFLFL